MTKPGAKPPRSKPTPLEAAAAVFVARIRRVLDYAASERFVADREAATARVNARFEARVAEETGIDAAAAKPSTSTDAAALSTLIDAAAADPSTSRHPGMFVAEFLARGYDPRTEPGALDAMAALFAADVVEAIDFYNVAPRDRAAVAERVAAQWRLGPPSGASTSYDAEPLGPVEDPRAVITARWEGARWSIVFWTDAFAPNDVSTRTGAWPLNVTLDEVADLYERAARPRERSVARLIREGSLTLDPAEAALAVRDPVAKQKSDRASAKALREHERAHPDVYDRGIEGLRTAALIVSAEKSIHEDQVRARGFAVSSTRVAQSATFALSNGGKRSAWGEGRAVANEDPKHDPKQSKALARRGATPALAGPPSYRAFLRVAWVGRFLRPVQLSLDFMGSPAGAAVFAMLDQLREDGLRDWLTLHRMAAEQGRTGELVWTWAEHKRGTAYETRVRKGNASAKGGARGVESDARAGVVANLRSIGNARLWLERVNDRGETLSDLVGGEPFLTITRELKEPSADLEAAAIRINPALYEGAHRDSEGGALHFVQVPEAVLRLDGPALRLAAMLSFEVRWARDKGCVFTLSESELHHLAGTYGDGCPKRRDLTHARRTLHNALDNALRALGPGASFDVEDTSTGKRYTIHPPRHMVDALVHDVQPALSPTRHPKLPRTGEQLAAWRAEKGRTQLHVAMLLGVSERTVRSAEKRPAETLPRKMLEHLGRLALPNVEQLAPVEAPQFGAADLDG